ncbi:DNA polymerase III, subunits gamma and tau [Arcobacter nitrofigilis DSM 7299]|uniref:DNA polymerase III subunit gamma/tau n=1 Tax=Arcobacter nitrofigilis (strain ATCC 33309 / DSM 7299 / CCUG 15893 / LMG 7604 / NCTC 12251 / CI) TaxID=572480 RepID=D5V6W3_ARCNC|nr:DNA polymerase III subunit gamma/tau [Arcobacter nitrofigilis]ADG94383.1 DNA polymerase III, subunits gamma and tau [Arcobacter nitrofigilis DSM 7299]
MSENQNSQKRVLALKYRPKRFEDLVGQGTVSQTLSLALDSNRLSHAYLFSGLRGSGKTSTARIMAKALLCSNGPTSKPCEVCENCVSANTNRHLDIIEMDAASNRGIDDIKDLIEHTKYKPSSARFKVFIIDEVHMLTTQAFNALLKTLEEPPGFVKFILATTDPLKLPATILSRTQHFRFKKISQKDVMNHLTHILNEEQIEFETEALEIVSRSGQGSLRDTLTLLDQAIIFAKGKVTTSAVVDMLGLIDPEFLDKLFDVILSCGDITPIVETLEEYEAGSVCDEMTIYLKNKMLYGKDPKFNVFLYDRFFRILGDAKHLLSLNSDPTFVLILTLSKMSEATNLKTLDEIIDEVQSSPIKEPVPQLSANKMTSAVNEKVVLQHAKEELPNTQTQTPVEKEVLETPQEQNVQTVEEEVQVEVAKPQEVVDPNVELYGELTKKVYERNHDLGECFEKNFIFESFENNILNIVSYAQDDDRKFLYKYFGIIKTFAKDIFGVNIDLEFKKGEIPEQKKNDVIPKKVETNTNDISEEDVNLDYENEEEQEEISSMVEDVEMGAGCVGSMHDTVDPKPSQKELQMEDLLNSSMVNKAKELFDIKKITVKTKI